MMEEFRLRTSLTLLFTLVAMGAQAQVDSNALPLFENISPTLGEVEIQFLDIPGWIAVQDHDGFMWLGDDSGLYRYDGYDYVQYQHDPEDPRSIGFDNTMYLYVDAQNTPWIGGMFGGLDKYDRHTDAFIHYQHDPDDPNSLSPGRVTYISQDSQGTLWIGTEGGLDRYDPDADAFIHYQHDPDNPSSLSHDYVWVIYEDLQGTIWVGTDGGLNKFDPVSQTFMSYLSDPEDPTSLLSNDVRSLLEDSQGTFWVGTLGDGLHTMDRTTGRFTRHRYNPDNPAAISSPYFAGSQAESQCGSTLEGCGGVSFIYEDLQGMLWIGGYGGGVNRYDLETGLMSHHTRSMGGFIDTAHYRIGESHDGTLWVGNYDGMHRVVSSAYSLPHITFDPDDEGGLGAEFVTRLMQDRKGDIWLGYSLGGGLDRYNPTTGLITHYKYDPDNDNSVKYEWISTIMEASDGLIWIGYSNSLFSVLDPETGRFSHFDTPYPGRSNVKSLREDSKGRIWIGDTIAGLFQFVQSTGEFIAYRHDEENPESLSDNRVYRMIEDRNGLYWLATRNGLNRFDPDTEVFTRYFPGKDIRNVLEDRLGRLWLATWGEGLYEFDPVSGATTQYTVEDGLPTEKVKGLLEDEDGGMWITTVEGGWASPINGRLSRFDKESKSFTNFDKQNGLPEIGFSSGSTLKTHDGTLLFGGDGGLIIIDPEAVRRIEHRAPKMAITGLRLGNEEVVLSPDGPLTGPIQLTEELRLTHDQKDFTIQYAGLAFRHPEGVQYHYKLDGYDTDWVAARTQRSARYSGVGPGSYTFSVRAIDSRGQHSENEASIRITVLPPWWWTPPMFVVYGVLLLGCIYGVDRIQRRRLLAKERERTRERELADAREIERAHTELQRTHQHLKTTQQQLVQQEKMASLGQLTAGIAHEIKNPLNFVNNFGEINEELANDLTEQLEANSDKKVEDIKRDLLDVIGSFKTNSRHIVKHGKRADEIVKSMMQHAASSEGERYDVAINPLVDEMIKITYGGMQSLKPDLEVSIEKNLDESAGSLIISPQEIGRVLQNILGNALEVVHEKKRSVSTSYEPKISVMTRRENGQVEIRVRDNGPGIPQEALGKIFEPFFTTKPAGSGTGLGLSLSYDIVTQGHGGRLEVESTEGDGATFVISLPVKDE